MTQISLDNHDTLEKLSIIKNALFVALEKPDRQDLIQTALEANQDLINKIKEATKNGKNINY